MKICSQCGKQFDDSVEYCDRCGSPLGESQPDIKEETIDKLDEQETIESRETEVVEKEEQEELSSANISENKEQNEAEIKDTSEVKKESIEKKQNSKKKKEKKQKSKKERSVFLTDEEADEVASINSLIKLYLIGMIPIFGWYIIIKTFFRLGNTDKVTSNIMRANIFIVSIWIIIICILNSLLGQIVVRI